MFYKSNSYENSTAVSAPRRSHIRTALLALPVIGLAIAVANIPCAQASISPLKPHGANTTTDPGTKAARLAADAVTRASQNRNIPESRRDMWGNPVYPGIEFQGPPGINLPTNRAGARGR